MTFLQKTGICWYANKITEVSFFILHHKKGEPSKKASFRKQTKNNFEIIDLYFTSMGVYFMHLIFFLFFSSMSKYFESKTEVRRLKNKAIITIYHIRYLEECSVTNKIHLRTCIYRIAMRSAWNDRGRVH